MFWKKHESEAITLYHYDVVENSDELIDGETDTARHCAWCGDPPDSFGSHSICSAHSDDLIRQSTERRERKRGRS